MTLNRIFLNKLFSFIGIGFALYIIANVYTWVSNDAIIKNTVKCKYCRKRISEKVKIYFKCSRLVLFTDKGHIGTPLCELHQLAGWKRGANKLSGSGFVDNSSTLCKAPIHAGAVHVWTVRISLLYYLCYELYLNFYAGRYNPQSEPPL